MSPAQRSPVTDHIKATITALRERVGGRRLWAIIAERPDKPDGLHAATLTHVLSGRNETIETTHLDFLEGLLSAPDRVLGIEHEGVPEGHATLCPALHGELKRLREASQIGPYRLANMIDPSPPGLNERVIGLWLAGTVDHVPADHLALVMASWRAAPPLAPLNDELRDHLKFELARTGHTPAGLCNVLGHTEIDARLLSRWMSGAVGKAREDLLNSALNGLKRLPTQSGAHSRSKSLEKVERLDWTDVRKTALIEERDRTGLSHGTVLTRFADTKPANLTGQRISNWLNRPNKTVPKHHYEWLLQAYRQLPDA